MRVKGCGFDCEGEGFGLQGSGFTVLMAQGSGLRVWGLEKGIQNSMAQGRSTKIIPIIKWIQTSRLSIKNFLSLSLSLWGILGVGGLKARARELYNHFTEMML